MVKMKDADDVKTVSIKDLTKKKKKYNAQDNILLLEEKKLKLADVDPTQLKLFTDLPLSKSTLKGLEKSGFIEPTKIQQLCLPHALLGLDVVGTSKTGSGKTLAFIIPMLELLYCKLWTKIDGIGCVIVTPRRELAYQIFEVIKQIGLHHSFSAGLVIGGKDLKQEWDIVGQCNILVCTPGRLVQHMTENYNFNTDTIQMLILDEADECLSMGFSDSLDVILKDLPPVRQTLLFSATQTKKIKDLIKAGCTNPVICSAHEFSKTITPLGLVEQYTVCNHQDKLQLLWAFLNEHQKMKILVFVSTAKEVMFISYLFEVLRLPQQIFGYHGDMNQLRRMATYDEFRKKKACVLICTDVASRGLDFPDIHWVFQMDAPANVDDYIHRVGRTARYQNAGETILLLTPDQETPMLEELATKRITLDKVDVGEPSKMNGISEGKMRSSFYYHPELGERAIRMFRTYIKSCYLLRPALRSLANMDMGAYAASLGLLEVPSLQRDFVGMETRRVARDNKEVVPVTKREEPTCSLVTPDDTFVMVESKRNPHQVAKPLSTDAQASFLIKNEIQLNKKTLFNNDDDVTDEQETQDKNCDTPFATENCGEFIANALKNLKAGKLDRNERKKQWLLKKQRKNTKEDESDPEVYEAYSDDGEEDDVDNPNLDDLPDPDKYYGNTSSSEEPSLIEKKAKKKIKKHVEEIEKPKKKKRKHNEEVLDKPQIKGQDVDEEKPAKKKLKKETKDVENAPNEETLKIPSEDEQPFNNATVQIKSRKKKKKDKKD